MTDTKKFESEKIWDEIKDRPIEAFGLPNQKVHQHVKKIAIPGNDLYVKLNASAFLPWLETSLGSEFSVELADGFVVVKRTADNTSKVKNALKTM